MNNLITTVLGMTLAAGTASMSVSYGGEALRSGATKVVAANAVSTATQIASAVQLYDVQEGEAYDGPSLQGLVSSSYLKRIPPNPAHAGDPVIARDASGERVAAIPLGDEAGDVCRVISRISPGGEAGCIATPSGPTAAYVRI